MKKKQYRSCNECIAFDGSFIGRLLVEIIIVSSAQDRLFELMKVSLTSHVSRKDMWFLKYALIKHGIRLMNFWVIVSVSNVSVVLHLRIESKKIFM